MVSVGYTPKIELYIAAAWVDVSADLVGMLQVKYGNWANGPMDRVAQTGMARFSLDNSEFNTSRTLGRYSPGHVSVLAGFMRGIAVRVSFTYDGQLTPQVKHIGKIQQILPVPGIYGGRVTECIAFDWMDDLATHSVRQVGIQINKRADQLVQAIIDSMPAASQPVGTDLDECIDTFPVAFDDLGGGVSGMHLVSQIVQSELGAFHVKGDGTIRLESRHARALAPVAATFDGDLASLAVPGSLAQAYNDVRVTIHAKTIGDTVVVLTAQAAGDAPLFAPGETKVLWSEYRDPDDPQVRIGGTEFEELNDGATDYAANSAADGSGTDLTASVSVTVEPFAGDAKWTITNNSASALYLITRQLRGLPIYDQSPATYERSSIQPYGQRTLKVDMPYQDDPIVAQGAADYLENQWRSLEQRADQGAFYPQSSLQFMQWAMSLEPGDRINVTEQVTGLDEVDVFVQGVQIDVDGDRKMTCTFALAPAVGTDFWILDDPVASILDFTTIPGYV